MQDLLGAGKGIPQLGGVQGLQQADVVLDGPLKGIRSGVLGRGLPAEQGFQLAEGGPLLLVLIETDEDDTLTILLTVAAVMLL